jgi:hypothetical protein
MRNPQANALLAIKKPAPGWYCLLRLLALRLPFCDAQKAFSALVKRGKNIVLRKLSSRNPAVRNRVAFIDF